MKYKPFKQEKENYCMSACLQAILQRNNIVSPSQDEIFSSFKTNEKGIDISPTRLEAFLANFGMTSEYAHHRLCFFEIDFIIQEELKKGNDIFAVYYHDQKSGHSSLVTGLENGEPILQCPQNGIVKSKLPELLELMPLDFQCGFYIVSQEAGQESHSAG